MLLKNGIRGTYHAVGKDYLQDYVNEYVFRYILAQIVSWRAWFAEHKHGVVFLHASGYRGFTQSRLLNLVPNVLPMWDEQDATFCVPIVVTLALP